MLLSYCKLYGRFNFNVRVLIENNRSLWVYAQLFKQITANFTYYSNDNNTFSLVRQLIETGTP